MSSRIPQMLLVLIVLLSVGPGLGGATPRDETISGPAVPVPADMEDGYRNIIQDVADSYGLEARGEVFLIYEEGITYIVSSPHRPQAGVADVSGTVIRPEETGTGDVGLIFADSVSVSQSGPTVSPSSLQQNTDAYAGRVVEVPGHYREATMLTDMESVKTRSRVGWISSSESTLPLIENPGQIARFGSANLSQLDRDGGRLMTLSMKVERGTSKDSSPMAAYRTTSWWVNAHTTVSVLVLPDDFLGGVGYIQLFQIATDVHEQETVTPDAIQSRGDELVGKVVTVQGQAVGSRLSSQETLLAAAKCAPDSIIVPSAGCIPLPTDVALHTGVVASSGSPSNAIPYAGLSNQHQDVPVTDERGEYQLTGRVVKTEQIDPRLPRGYGLVVYERERVGALGTTQSGESVLKSAATDVTDQLRSQLVMSHSEYEETSEQHQRQPTATPTASPTETSSQTSTEATPTDSDKTDTQSSAVVTDVSTAYPTETPTRLNQQTVGGIARSDIMLGGAGIGIIIVLVAGFVEAGLWLKEWLGRPADPKYTRRKNLAAVGGAAIAISAIGYGYLGMAPTVGGLIASSGLVYGWSWISSRL